MGIYGQNFVMSLIPLH